MEGVHLLSTQVVRLPAVDAGVSGKQQSIATSNTSRRDPALAGLAGKAAAGLRGVDSIPSQAKRPGRKHLREDRNTPPHRLGSEGALEARAAACALG